jgi:hypothetical protein
LIDFNLCYIAVATTGSRRIFVRPIKALRADGMPIGELSRLCGVNIETIRYYEKIKMLPAPLRTEAGHRVYRPNETRILVFIRRGAGAAVHSRSNPRLAQS